MADNLDPDRDSVSHPEGMAVTLKCSYDTSKRYVWLYWYRQYPDEAPQWLLYKSARSSSAAFRSSDKRFTSNTGETFTELSINHLTLADTALYYCALWDQPSDTKSLKSCTKTHI